MSVRKAPFDFTWDVDKYRSNYDPEHWELCRTFMTIHKTKYPEQRLVHLTEAFYQMGVYGSSYDPKTTRMVSSLVIEVLDDFLQKHPGTLKHPFNKALTPAEVIDLSDDTPEGGGDSGAPKASQSSSIWDVAVDKNIIVNVLISSQLKTMLKGFVIIYDIRRASTMNDNKISILEESFKRSKFGVCHWHKEDTSNKICPIRLTLKWKATVLAEAEGSDEKALRIRLAQAVLSKLAAFSPGIEAKWRYFRDGRIPDVFENPNPRKSNIYKIVPRSQFKGMAEITSYIDTFANSDSFAEVVFGMDFSNLEKKQMTDYVSKTWATKLTYRTVSKMGVKNKTETHICIYHIRTGEELKRWLDQCGGDNERYRLIPSGEHRRAGACDNNVREVLSSSTVEDKENITSANDKSKLEEKNKGVKEETPVTEKTKPDEVKGAEELEKLLDGFVLFYNAKKNSEIDKDDWLSVLCESFKVSKFGPLRIVTEDVRALRTRCTLKLKDMTLASAEGLTETQAKTAATLQLISKLEAFTYIIQAKEEYFFGGKVPPFIENTDPKKSNGCRVVRRKDLPSYYSIFQTIDEFIKKPSYGELVFGADFTWELKNEIVVYIKDKELDFRYFTINEQKPWTHMAVYQTIKPEKLKDHLLKTGGENEKYKLIPPQRAEPASVKTAEVKPPKVTEKPGEKISLAKVAEKRRLQEREPSPKEDLESNKIQIKLKFKKDKVEYPEDTGGDFPGLILWVGIKKNSMWQRNLFCILLESFKMSKYGELVVEECEENVWGRKEPFKKCVIKANRKVLAVGLGESKTEAKNSASLQVLRQLRKHCYTIQAKESYFKEGKATPYDFNPDPAKNKVYRVEKRSKFKDRGSIIKFVDNFNKSIHLTEEVIFGDDFSYDEREYILQHCRQINLNYRLMKCQSSGKIMHTHIALYHQKPLPMIKAGLMDTGGENDRYRLISPGEKITSQLTAEDLWPDTLENAESNQAKKPEAQKVLNGHQAQRIQPITNLGKMSHSGPTLSLDFNKSKALDDFTPTMHIVNSDAGGSKIPVKISDLTSESRVTGKKPRDANERQLQSVEVEGGQKQPPGNLNQPPGNMNQPPGNIPVGAPNQPGFQQPMEYMMYPQVMPGPIMQEMPFGPQPLVPMYGQPFQDMPLMFGPQPDPTIYNNNPPMFMVPGPTAAFQGQPVMVPPPVGNEPPQIETKQVDLREEIEKKRSQTEKSPGKKAIDAGDERKVTMKEGDPDDSWSRKVFVSKEDALKQREPRSRSDERKRAERPRRPTPDRGRRRLTPDKDRRRMSPGRDLRRITPDRDRRRPPSPGKDRRRPYQEMSPRRYMDREDGRNIREQDMPYDGRVERFRNRSRSRSPRRPPAPFRDRDRAFRTPSPVMQFRELWDNISERFSETIFMYKYVLQDSTTETDPFALLRATRSLAFNIDFDLIQQQVSRDEWEVAVELVVDEENAHPLVGEGVAPTERQAKLIAAHHAVDTIQKACRVIQPNYEYFADGGVPDFIKRKSPRKTTLYEIIQNLDPNKPLERYTTEVMFRMFLSSELEDLFFLATDFSYLERVLVIEVATQMNLWWRLFGPRHPDALPDDVVSTQHICVYKQKSAMQLVRELIASGGTTQKFTLVPPLKGRQARSGDWDPRDQRR